MIDRVLNMPQTLNLLEDDPQHFCGQARYDLMPRNKFKYIFRSFHFCEYKKLHKYDKFLKLLPVINKSERTSFTARRNDSLLITENMAAGTE